MASGPSSRLRESDEQLLRRYAEGEIAAREAIARRYMAMARRVTVRYHNGSHSQEDLHQVAYLSLLKAIDRFDPSAGAFAGYAFVCIRGELKRYFREHSSAMRVGRDLQERWLRVSNAQERLTTDLGTSPNPREIAAELDLTLDEVLDAIDVGSAYSVRALDAPVQNDEAPDLVLGDLIGEQDQGFANVEFGTTIEPAFRELSDKERDILRMRFHDDLTQSEIGGALGISQMHVSRLLRRALTQLHQAADLAEPAGKTPHE